MTTPRPAAPIRYALQGSEKWGYYVYLTGVDHTMAFYPEDDRSIDWATPEDARKAAVESLRSLADRIERGET